LCGQQSRGLPLGTSVLESRCESRAIGLVLKAATRTQGIMARKELPEERAQVKELQRQLEHARAKLADAQFFSDSDVSLFSSSSSTPRFVQLQDVGSRNQERERESEQRPNRARERATSARASNDREREI